MNQSKRICKMKGHNELPIHHFCTRLECTQPTRWSCGDCISNGIHNHDKQNNFYISKIFDFINRQKDESEKIYEHYSNIIVKLEKVNKNLLGVEKTILSCRQYIEGQITQCKRRIKLFQNALALDSFELLDDHDINEILSIIKEYQDDKNQNPNIIVDDNKRKFKMDETKLPLCGFQMCKNQQYFAYGGEDKLLNIYDAQTNNKVKEIQLDGGLVFCQFTQDSSLLFVALIDGYVQGFDAQNQFNQFFKKQIHKKQIFKIITIQNEYLLTCSSDWSLIKTDIKNQQQIVKLTGHNNFITGIDYNAQADIIVSGSLDHSIILWNCKEKNIINKKNQAHDDGIISIQFANKHENILSIDGKGTLNKWKVDLINNLIFKIQQLNYLNEIFQILQVPQTQILLLICNKQVKILSQQGDTLHQIQHNCQCIKFII